MAKRKDPRVGTGKKPKGSGRRLYTDENPKDTVRIKYATPADARATAAKVKRINKPYARKIQILTVMEQRSKVSGKTEQARIAKKAKESLRKRHGAKKVAKSLKAWTKQKWRTKSGKPSTQGPNATGERYLPSSAIKSLSSSEYAATSRAKRRGKASG